MRARLFAVLSIALVGAVAYAGVGDLGFVWDDDDYVTGNPVLRTPAGLWSIWFEPRSLPQYYPLVHTTFWLEYRLWGAAPLGYHVVNVLLHLGAACAFWRLLVRLGAPGALFAALCFAAHPVHVESVAWVTERKNVLSLCCALLAAHGWLHWREGGRGRVYVVASAWFVAALLSKTVTATLPAALLVLVWWRHGRIERRDWRAVAPWLVFGAGLGCYTAWLEAAHVGAAGVSDLDAIDRLHVAVRAPWFYIGKLLWPVGLCFNYPRWQLAETSAVAWTAASATVGALVAAFVLRDRLGRGPLAVLLLFGGTLVPALGFLDVYPFRFSFVADHFQYHASLAVIGGVAAVAAPALAARLPRAGVAAAAAAVVAALALLAGRQVPNYRDESTLWAATLRCNPASALAMVNLAGAALARGDTATVRALSERVLEVDPDNPESLANLGVIAHRANDLDAAQSYYERARAIRPDFATNLRNLGALLHQRGESAAALPLVQRAIELDPEYLDARTTLVSVLHALQRWPECLAAAEWVLRWTPDAVEPRLRAAEAALAAARPDAAAAHAALVLRALPTLEQARRIAVRAVAARLRQLPVAEARAAAERTAPEFGVPVAAWLSELAGELARVGAAAHAAALR